MTNKEKELFRDLIISYRKGEIKARITSKGNLRLIEDGEEMVFPLNDEQRILLTKYKIPKEKNNYKLSNNPSRYRNKNTNIKKRPLGRTLIIAGVVITIAASTLIPKNESDSTYYETDTEITTEAERENINNDLITYIEEDLEINNNYSEREETIRHICDIYQVNYDIIYPKLIELTDNFTNDNYMNGTIEGVSCKGMKIQTTNDEELLIYAIRSMKQLPENFDLDISNLYVNNGYSSGNNYYQQIDYASKIIGVDRDALYAIINAETSFNSDLFIYDNNPAGLRSPDGNGWWYFSTKEEGILEFAMQMVKYCDTLNLDPHNLDEEDLALIQTIHAPLSDGNEYWLTNVIEGRNYSIENSERLYETQNKKLT